MPFRINPILAAILAGSCSVGHAAVNAAQDAQATEVRSDLRTPIIDGDPATAGSPAAADLVIAQSAPDSHRKEVRVITSGQPYNLPDLPDVNMIISHAMSEAFSGGASMPTAKVVKNAPYSAEVISEKVQILADGNQISRKTSSMAYRDSAGRTRQETRDSKGEVRTVQIHDSVNGARYVLSPGRKSATKISFDNDLHKRIEEIKLKARNTAKHGRAQIIEHADPGEEILVKRIELPSADGKKEVREEVRVRVMRAASDAAKTGGQAAHSFDGESISHAISEMVRNGPIGMSFQDMKWSAKSITTSLATRDFDGVRAEGKSVSYSIPAGEVGNKNPIVVSTETWTSPDLQVVVYSRHSDPRVGDSVYRLANVKAVEPPAALFVVPEGYSVKELPGPAVSPKQK